MSPSHSEEEFEGRVGVSSSVDRNLLYLVPAVRCEPGQRLSCRTEGSKNTRENYCLSSEGLVIRVGEGNKGVGVCVRTDTGEEPRTVPVRIPVFFITKYRWNSTVRGSPFRCLSQS